MHETFNNDTNMRRWENNLFYVIDIYQSYLMWESIKIMLYLSNKGGELASIYLENQSIKSLLSVWVRTLTSSTSWEIHNPFSYKAGWLKCIITFLGKKFWTTKSIFLSLASASTWFKCLNLFFLFFPYL